MDYRPRIVDGLVDEAMADLAAIALEGARGVGKTATASRRARTILSLTDPQVRAAVAANYNLVDEVEPPVFVDEWQLEPAVFDRVRHAVDEAPEAVGRFLLAGSAGVSPDARIHSGAGRIARLAMRPMSVSERGMADPTVSLASLASGDARIAGRTEMGVRAYCDEILRSGFPGIRVLSERGRRRQLDSYLARIVDHDMPEAGITVRRPAALRSWLRAYAAATATTADYTTILDAATAGEPDKPARATVTAYREHLAWLFILDSLPAWVPTFASLKRLTRGDKHHLVDPALAARLVGVGAEALMIGRGDRVSATSGTFLGALFESLAVQSLRVYAQAIDADVGHLRTKNGDHEIDLIVETADRRIIAVEVKLAGAVYDADVRHLNWLAEAIGPRLIDRIVVTTGPQAYRRDDGVAVVPLALLGP